VLLLGHVTTFKHACAIGALLFSVYNLVAFAYDYGKQQQASSSSSSEPLLHTAPPSHAFEYDESLCVITNCPARPETPHWRWLTPFYDANPRVRSCVESIFPRISEAHRKTESCVCALTLSSLASGFLLGLTGSATSPTLVAFRCGKPPPPLPCSACFNATRSVFIKPSNPEPQTPNPKPQTPNPKPQTPNPKPQLRISYIDATKASIRGIIVLGHGSAALVLPHALPAVTNCNTLLQ